MMRAAAIIGHTAIERTPGCCKVHRWSTMQVSHEARTASRQLALGGVGCREVKIFNVDHPLSESTIENRESHITDRKGEIQVSRPGRAGP